MKEEQERIRREEDCCELLIWNFPAELKKQFKIYCAENEVTMRDKVIQLVGECCNNA